MWLFLLLCLVTSSRSEVVRVRAKQMGLRSFDLPVKQYLDEKTGPVQFPADGPPSGQIQEPTAEEDLYPDPILRTRKPGAPRSGLRNPDYEYLDAESLALFNLVERKPAYLRPSPTTPETKRPVVYSKPVTETIARSDLHPVTPRPSKQYNKPIATTAAAQSRLNEIEYKPSYLQAPPSYLQPSPSPEYKSSYVQAPPSPEYKPSYLQASPSPLFLVNAVTGRPIGYSNDYDLETGRRSPGGRLNDYEEHQQSYANLHHLNRVEDREDLTQNADYAFAYKVRDQKTGDDFSHRQQSTGSSTNGEYRVRLPDGRMQVVSYIADENGYKADVRYHDDKTITNSVSNDNIQTKSSHDYKHENSKSPNYVYDTNQIYDYSKNKLLKYDNKMLNDGFYKEAAPAPLKPVNQYDVKDYENIDHEDYSLEYNEKVNNYQPHKIKFSDLGKTKINSHNRIIAYKDNEEKATLKPSIEELRNLFLHKKPLPDVLLYEKIIPVEINVPSVTPPPETYDTSSEHVVVIGTKPNFYTDIRSTLATPVATPLYQRYSIPSPSFKKNIDYSGQKPVFSTSFFDRISKYIRY